MGEKKSTKLEEQEQSPAKDEVEISSILLFKSQDFLSDLDIAREMFEIIEPILSEKDEEQKKHVDSIIDEITGKIKEVDDSEEDTEVEISYNDLQKLQKGVSRMYKAGIMFRQNSIVLLISKLDEFVTELLKIALGENPEIVKNSEKSINYDQIFKYDSINDMIRDIVSEEIDSLMRKSHAVSISYLDDSFKLGVIENITDWPAFIELTQRRNLFVHSGGKINSQYIENCKKYKVELGDDIEVGKGLSVDQEYFQRSFLLLYEIGIRLSQALYRRLFPDKLNKANTILNDIGFDLMVEERWEIADIIFSFAVNIPEKLMGSREDYLRFLINSAICKKHLGEDKKLNKLLDSVDWGAYKAIFKLAVSVLKNEFEKASQIMLSIDTEEISDHSYRTWPLFKEFRETDGFKISYKKKFGEDYETDLKEEDILKSEDIEVA